MSFLTKEEIASIRAKNSRKFFVEEFGKEILLIKPSAQKSLEIGELQEKLKEGKITRADFMVFMLGTMCATLDGKMFDAETSKMVLEVISIESLNKLVRGFDKEEQPEGNSEGSQVAG